MGKARRSFRSHSTPFGAWGRRLGFRWVFFFTLPLPFHPLFLPLALIGMLAWTGIAALGTDGLWLDPRAGWITFLVVAAVIGVWLSIPVAAWLLLILGGTLIQSIAILGAVILFAVECWQGRVHPAWWAVPISYPLLFLIQSVGGKLWLAHLRKRQAEFVPLSAAEAMVYLPDRDHSPQQLVRKCNIGSVTRPSALRTREPKRYFWVSTLELETLKATLDDTLPTAWHVREEEGGAVLTWKGAPLPSSRITLHKGSYRTLFWLVTGLRYIAASGPLAKARLLQSKPQTVANVPLAGLFRYTSISGPAHNVLVAGFWRRTGEAFETSAQGDLRGYERLFEPRKLSADETRSAGFAELLEEAHRIVAERRARDEELAEELPHFLRSLPSIDMICASESEMIDFAAKSPAQLTSDAVPHVLGLIGRLVRELNGWDIVEAARLLAAFPDEALAAHRSAIGELFNSRKLALQWTLFKDFDIDSLPKNTPIFYDMVAGYGLLQANPVLYDKLARIDPEMAPVVSELKRQIAAGEPGLYENYVPIPRKISMSARFEMRDHLRGRSR